MLITAYPDIVRREGLAVEVVAGFASRSHGEFQRNPPYIVWHHDASPAGPSPGVLGWMLSNWDNASANAWVDYNGKWWFVGAGVAYHAGAVLPGMPNNQTAMGIETDYTVGEEISWNLYDSLRRGTAAIMRANGQPDDDLHFHKSICKPVGRKSDPWGMDLQTERNAVGAIKRGGNSPLTLPDQNAPQGAGGADPKTEDETVLKVLRCDGVDYAYSPTFFRRIETQDEYFFFQACGLITTAHGAAQQCAKNLIEFIEDQVRRNQAAAPKS